MDYQTPNVRRRKRDELDIPVTERKSPHCCPVLSLKRYKEPRKRKSVEANFRALSAQLTPPANISMYVRRPDHPIWIGSLNLQEIGGTSLAVVVAAPVLRLESASLVASQ